MQLDAKVAHRLLVVVATKLVAKRLELRRDNVRRERVAHRRQVRHRGMVERVAQLALGQAVARNGECAQRAAHVALAHERAQLLVERGTVELLGVLRRRVLAEPRAPASSASDH